MVVSTSPCCRVSCATFVALLVLVCMRARNSSPSGLKTAQFRRFSVRWASLFADGLLGGPLLGELFRGPTAAGSRWANFWCLDGGCVPPLGLGHAHAPRSRVDVALDVGLVPSPRSRAHQPSRPSASGPSSHPSTGFPQDSSRFAENATHPYI